MSGRCKTSDTVFVVMSSSVVPRPPVTMIKSDLRHGPFQHVGDVEGIIPHRRYRSHFEIPWRTVCSRRNTR